MMRIGLLIIGLLLGLYLQAQSLKQVREQYEIAYQKESVAETLANALGYNDPVLLGYKASAKMMLAKYYWNPYTKYMSFVEGRDALEKLIANNVDNFELRYLRLIIQSNCPSFLGYSDQIKTDKEFVKLHFKDFLQLRENGDFASKVLSYLVSLNAFSEEEIETLKEQVN
jgi:hypothetical protein